MSTTSIEPISHQALPNREEVGKIRDKKVEKLPTKPIPKWVVVGVVVEVAGVVLLGLCLFSYYTSTPLLSPLWFKLCFSGGVIFTNAPFLFFCIKKLIPSTSKKLEQNAAPQQLINQNHRPLPYKELRKELLGESLPPSQSMQIESRILYQEEEYISTLQECDKWLKDLPKDCEEAEKSIALLKAQNAELRKKLGKKASTIMSSHDGKLLTNTPLPHSSKNQQGQQELALSSTPHKEIVIEGSTVQVQVNTKILDSEQRLEEMGRVLSKTDAELQQINEKAAYLTLILKSLLDERSQLQKELSKNFF